MNRYDVKTAKCPECGYLVMRRRGNLRSEESWKRAVNALLDKHLRNHTRGWEKREPEKQT